MPLTEGTKKVIEYLSSIAETLSIYGDENKGVNQYLAARGETDKIREIVQTSSELTDSQKAGMYKLVEFLKKELDERISMYNSTQY